VIAGSRYTNDDPDDCHIVGDANIYGLGIRIGYYLQFIAAVLSPYLAPNQLINICLAFSAFTLASFAAVYENAVQGYFISLDWHITVVLTMCLGFATFVFNPGLREATIPEYIHPMSAFYPTWTGGKIKPTFYGPLGALYLLVAMDFFTAPWMYWKGNYQGTKDGCNMYFYLSLGIFAFWVNIHNRKWIIVIKILSILGTFLGLIMCLCGLLLLWVASSLERGTTEPRVATGSKWIKIVYTHAQLFTGGWAIAIIELTLKRNKIDLSGTSITSSGQLIPLLVGALSLCNVFLTYIRNTMSGFERIPAVEAYVGFISGIATQIERIIGGKKKKKQVVENDEPGEEVELIDQTDPEPVVLNEPSQKSVHDDTTQAEERIPIWQQFTRTESERWRAL
jgi:hypothetical protein